MHTHLLHGQNESVACDDVPWSRTPTSLQFFCWRFNQVPWKTRFSTCVISF